MKILKEADSHRESPCHVLERAQLTNMTAQQTVSEQLSVRDNNHGEMFL